MANHVGWQFTTHQCVTHIGQPMPSLVIGRSMASNGIEFYSVRSIAHKDPNRDRIVEGAMLRDSVPETSDCAGCLLLRTPACRGLR